MTATLFDPPTPKGRTFDATLDGPRLAKQAAAVWHFMAIGDWHTLREISDATAAPEASASARLRDFRRAGHTKYSGGAGASPPTDALNIALFLRQRPTGPPRCQLGKEGSTPCLPQSTSRKDWARAMVAGTTGLNGHRLAALVQQDAPDIRKIDGRTCLVINDQRPLTDVRAFEQSGGLIRPVPVPGKPHLCLMVKMRVTEHGGLRVIEANVLSVGFWNPFEAEFFWGTQLCVTSEEAEAGEVLALTMV